MPQHFLRVPPTALPVCLLAWAFLLGSPGTAAAAEPPPHWAFQPIRTPPLPAGIAPHPVDAFLRVKLREHNLKPSPEADRRTLLRRLSFDLTGLPPTAAEVEEFEADSSPAAYDRVLDRLLASPRLGERWGRHWLDVARYADNKGYVFFEDKNYPWAWTYREYVITALNRDLPYDRFLLEQIAADQLVLADNKSLAALGFLTIGGHFMGNTHDIIDDRIDLITRGLLGLSVSCARCHDHKFDPVSTADYYSLYGIFRSCTEPIVPPLWGDPPATEDYRKFAEELAVKEKNLTDFVTGKHRELVTQARLRAGDYLLAAHAIRDQPPSDDFMLIADRGDLNPAMIARWRAFLDATRKRRDPAWAIWHRYADLAEKDFADQAGKLSHEDTENTLVRAAFSTPPISMKEVAARYGRLLADAEKAAPDAPADLLALRAALYGPKAPADAPLELDWGFLSLFPDRATQGEYQKLIKDLETHMVKGPPRAMVLRDAPRPHDPRIFVRGHPNRPGETVPRQFLTALTPRPVPFTQGSGRLELARAIASRDNPLTARVLVNRVWMHLFSRGIVATPGDFGLRGDPPTHPELLDWLAADFMDHGWSLKHLLRRIVTSAAYRQAGLDHPQGIAIDPDNRLLWKQNRRRLEFEPLHDGLLAVSGNLGSTLGGPSFPLFTGKTRRAVYGYIDRLEFPSLLATFDVPNPATTSPERTRTTVAPQALYLMNGPFVRDAARRLLNTPTIQNLKPAEEKLKALYLAVYSRKPTRNETERALSFLSRGNPAERWLDMTHALLLSNEFAFID